MAPRPNLLLAPLNEGALPPVSTHQRRVLLNSDTTGEQSPSLSGRTHISIQRKRPHRTFRPRHKFRKCPSGRHLRRRLRSDGQIPLVLAPRQRLATEPLMYAARFALHMHVGGRRPRRWVHHVRVWPTSGHLSLGVVFRPETLHAGRPENRSTMTPYQKLARSPSVTPRASNGPIIPSFMPR